MMPSLPSLLKRSKRSTEQRNGPQNDSTPGAIAQKGTAEKVQRRHSKRDFFRNLFSPNGSRSESRASHRPSDEVKQDLEASTSDKIVIPMPNSNKPLPAPPPPAADEPDVRATASTKLNRIISPLDQNDIYKLFSGAPQFFVRSEGRHTGPPRPSVAFPWNIELEIRDLSDHSQIEDRAWSSVTACPHITRDLHKNKDVIIDQKEKQRGHFMPTCHERPNMLCMQGLERGTVGFSAALEIGVADALCEGSEIPASPGSASLAERRNAFLNDKKHGVRPMAESDIVAKLIEIGKSYHDLSLSYEKSTVESYTEIFTQILFPPTRVTDSNDPYSLQVQIEALIDVLAIPHIWIDFSIIEWRIRLGQILWGPSLEHETGIDKSLSVEVYDSGVPSTDKFWLLLQILLSCELLTRLDLVTKKAYSDPTIITVNEVRQFEEDAKRSVRWSMILARAWLENVLIESTQPPASSEEKRPPSGWLATLTGAAAATPKDVPAGNILCTEFQGRHQTRQISGLLHFARKLHWPDVETISAKFSQPANLFKESTSNTPVIGTPLSITTQRSSYFGISARPAIKRGISRQKQRRSIMVQPSGWLSRSYLAGLILPGEGLGHFLISTLLENDEAAVARLGDEANLYGGFVYSAKSYWSTACVIGRILAAGKGASECMGWLSSDILPKEMGDGWVNIEVEMAPKDGDGGPETARIWKKHLIEKDGYVLGDGEIATILPGDFTLPVDDVRDAENLEVTLKSLEFSAVADSENDPPLMETPTPMSENTEVSESLAIRTYSAIMKFNISTTGGGIQELTFDISYDVHFVTAHPCVPSHHASILNTPTSPSFRVPTPPPQVGDTKLGPHELYAGHPLHKSFTYKREVFSQLLSLVPASPPSSSSTPLASLHTASREIFVIDCNEPDPPSQCTPHADVVDDHSHPSSMLSAVAAGSLPRKRHWGSDLEVLARAWCAERGYNALISRRGRNCVACSIREARALGWKIVLRFG